jgi:hypothetical protein
MTSQDSVDKESLKSEDGKSIHPSSDSIPKKIKNNTGKHSTHEAPKHHNPDPAKLDSIKKSKEKYKKD